MSVQQEHDFNSYCGSSKTGEMSSFKIERDVNNPSTDIDIKLEYPFQSVQFPVQVVEHENPHQDNLLYTKDQLELGDDDDIYSTSSADTKVSKLQKSLLSKTICHNLINSYVECLGFEDVVNGRAKYCVNSNGRFMYINSNEFGMNRGQTKVGQIFYPDKKYWSELRKFANISDVIFIPINYKPCHSWSVNGRKKQGKAQSTLHNWREHCGLLVRKGEKLNYYDCQFYTGATISKHYVYQAVATTIRRKLSQVFDWPSVSSIECYKFSQSFGKNGPCAAVVLQVLEAIFQNEDIYHFTSENSILTYLNKVCDVLEEKGCST